MLCIHRTWNVRLVEDLNELATLITGTTWTADTGFEHGGLLFLNDAFSEDGAQEYAVIDKEEWWQVESATCSWMTPASFVAMVEGLFKSDGVYGLPNWGLTPGIAREQVVFLSAPAPAVDDKEAQSSNHPPHW